MARRAHGPLPAAGGSAAHTAAAVYSLFMVFHALAFQAMWWHLTRTGHLFDDRVDAEAARATRARFALGSIGYPAPWAWPSSRRR